MKIGILTYIWDENHGTILQAYSLCKAVQEYIPEADVEIINYRHARNIQIIRNYIKIKHVAYDVIQNMLSEQFKKRKLKLGKKELVTRDLNRTIRFINESEYDVIIAGSDTIWQITENKRLPKFPNIYWMPGVSGCKKVAFAVSSNITRYENLSESARKTMDSALEKFSLIGVRDHMTLDLVKSVGYNDNTRLFRVFDPTFLVETPKTKMREKLIKMGVNLDKPILCINYPPKAPFCKEIIEKYKTMGFQIVTFLNRLTTADYHIKYADPFEWAEAYKYFDFVITDRFHGTIFSLKSKTPVLAVDWHPYRYDPYLNSKTESLLKDFGIQKTNHLNTSMMKGGINTFINKAEEARNKFDPYNASKKIDEIININKEFIGKIKSILE